MLRRIALTGTVVLGAAALSSIARRFADETMYVFFVAAVAVVAWRSGWRYGVATLVVSVRAVDYWFIEALGSLRLRSTVAISRLVSFVPVSVALCSAVEAALALTAPQAEAKQMSSLLKKWMVRLPASTIPIASVNLLINLISNAVKFTPPVVNSLDCKAEASA
jgi:K+-sensing histidine kinase KdpD